ncbi:hypothetical protein GCHA_2537 [Paraglaciecola chathamensis S18K6]|uniref:Uncharacterized protein n=2 Tax=Paraglaciecola chathamensis TaxID=368405 RepID=A0ABQ0IBG4_9ALTE|nr:hypothetical protein GAGA_3894 [Paraglaciecola agarilytica NO2]GAC10484.1 hypothetical protein GCHA_2537 [Paraglaciecola chathamensis S18K6]
MVCLDLREFYLFRAIIDIAQWRSFSTHMFIFSKGEYGNYTL